MNKKISEKKPLNANLFLSQSFSYPAAFFMDIFPFLLISNFLHQQFVASHDNNQNDGLLLWGHNQMHISTSI